MPKFVLAIDPGKATGIAMFDYQEGEEPVLMWSGEYQQNEYAKPIREAFALAITSNTPMDIVCVASAVLTRSTAVDAPRSFAETRTYRFESTPAALIFCWVFASVVLACENPAGER